MKAQALALAGAVALTGAASAAFTGVTVDMTENFDGSGLTQYRFYANFDAAGDTFNVWGGDVGLGVNLIMNTDAPGGFAQAPSGLDPVWGWDIANAYAFGAGGQLDTWFAMGSFGQASPGLLGLIGGHVGAAPIDLPDGGLFATEPASIVGASSVAIANIVIEDGYGIEFSGVVGWANGAEGGLVEFGYNDIPAPGALALLGLAGLAGTRRRR